MPFRITAVGCCCCCGVLQTLENTREKDVTMVEEGDEEVQLDEADDEFAGEMMKQEQQWQQQASSSSGQQGTSRVAGTGRRVRHRVSAMAVAVEFAVTATPSRMLSCLCIHRGCPPCGRAFCRPGYWLIGPARERPGYRLVPHSPPPPNLEA